MAELLDTLEVRMTKMERTLNRLYGGGLVLVGVVTIFMSLVVALGNSHLSWVRERIDRNGEQIRALSAGRAEILKEVTESRIEMAKQVVAWDSVGTQLDKIETKLERYLSIHQGRRSGTTPPGE